MKEKKSRKKLFTNLVDVCKNGNKNVVVSSIVMGGGQLMYKQWTKGILLLLTQIGFVAFFALYGAKAIAGFFTLGTVEANPWYGVEGDNSVTMLIMGILAFIVLAVYFVLYWYNIKDVFKTQQRVESFKQPLTFKEELNSLLGANFHVTVLFLPVLGV